MSGLRKCNLLPQHDSVHRRGVRGRRKGAWRRTAALSMYGAYGGEGTCCSSKQQELAALLPLLLVVGDERERTKEEGDTIWVYHCPGSTV